MRKELGLATLNPTRIARRFINGMAHHPSGTSEQVRLTTPVSCLLAFEYGGQSLSRMNIDGIGIVPEFRYLGNEEKAARQYCAWAALRCFTC